MRTESENREEAAKRDQPTKEQNLLNLKCLARAMSLTTFHKLRVRVGKRFNLSSLRVKKNVKKARQELNGAATIFMIKT